MPPPISRSLHKSDWMAVVLYALRVTHHRPFHSVSFFSRVRQRMKSFHIHIYSVGILCCHLVCVLGNDNSFHRSSPRGKVFEPLCFAKSNTAARKKKGSGGGFGGGGGGFGKAKGGVEQLFVLSKKAKKLLKKHGNNIDAASQDNFQASTANLASASLSMDELHAEKVKVRHTPTKP